MQSDGEEELDAPKREVQSIFGCPILAGVFSGKGGIPRISTHTVVDPTLRKKREGWGTRSSRRY
jgi:hypothetical protein